MRRENPRDKIVRLLEVPRPDRLRVAALDAIFFEYK
jgi:hypothetical protein